MKFNLDPVAVSSQTNEVFAMDTSSVSMGNPSASGEFMGQGSAHDHASGQATGPVPPTGGIAPSPASPEPAFRPNPRGRLSFTDPSLFQIDRQHLDVEWTRQSQLCYQVGVEAAKARVAYEDARRVYEVVRADVEMEARRHPEKFGFMNKPTEAALASIVTLDKRVIDAQRKATDAKYNFELCNVAVSSIENKKSALDALTRLLSMNYYSR